MPFRIAVVGGGVIGLTVAWECAVRGGPDIDVQVIDPHPGGRRGASWVAGGMLAAVSEAHQTEASLVELGLASSAAWPSFAARLNDASGGLDVGLSTQGTLVVARDADDAAELTVLQAVQERLGCGVERLTSAEARRLEPALAPTIRGALWLEGDHQVDNRMLLRALMTACDLDERITIVRSQVTGVRPGRVEVDDLSPGTGIDADAVVVCAGAWPVPISLDRTGGADLVFDLPIRPVKGQILRVQGVASAVMPTRTVRGLEVYVIPRPHGEIAIGATSEELGYDTRVTAGAVRDLLDRAWEVLPGLAEATFVEASAGLRPGTPDNGPLLGELAPGCGVYVAGGHYRNGVLLAPITGSLMASLVVDGHAPPLLGAFAPDRFGALVSSERTARHPAEQPS